VLGVVDLGSLTSDPGDHHVCAPAILELQASAWAGGQTVEDLLAAIERAGAVAFAEKARAALIM
jgi:hypothetical protein